MTGKLARLVVAVAIASVIAYRVSATLVAAQASPAPTSAACGPSSRPNAIAPSGDVLTLPQAIDLGLRQNLSVLEADASSAQARADRLKALAALLPNISARAGEVSERLSLREIGLALPGAPPTSGPFQFQDARVFVSQTIFSRELIDRYHADDLRARAAALSDDDMRDAVALAVGAAYLRIGAAASRLETANAELDTARELDRQTADRVRAEVAPEIDSLRAQVERQTAEQRVVDARNDLEKSSLALARVIGAPIDRPMKTDAAALPASLTTTQDAAVARALLCRSDLAAAKASLDAAADDVRAKRAQALPTAGVSADYGAGGAAPNFNQVYTVTAGVSVPIFTGGRIRADVAKAEADRSRHQAEYDDAVERVKYDVRVAWLDLDAAQSRAGIAARNRDLADRALVDAKDRYGNGVTNYLEVVTAQQQVAEANDRLIGARYDLDVSRLALARAMGGTVFSTGRE